MADATAKGSGYLASSIEVTFGGGQTYALNTASTGLVDNTWTELSDEINNGTDKHLLADWEFNMASASPTGTDAGLEIYVVRSVDGTNYPTWVSGVATEQVSNQQYFRDFAVLGAIATSAQRVTNNFPLLLPPGKYKLGFRNRANVALATSGNSFYLRPHAMLSDEA